MKRGEGIVDTMCVISSANGSAAVYLMDGEHGRLVVAALFDGGAGDERDRLSTVVRTD